MAFSPFNKGAAFKTVDLYFVIPAFCFFVIPRHFCHPRANRARPGDPEGSGRNTEYNQTCLSTTHLKHFLFLRNGLDSFAAAAAGLTFCNQKVSKEFWGASMR